MSKLRNNMYKIIKHEISYVAFTRQGTGKGCCFDLGRVAGLVVHWVKHEQQQNDLKRIQMC